MRRGGWKNASVGGWRADGQMVLILAIMELGTPGSRWKPRGSTWRNGASPASFFVSFASVFESEISPSGRCHIRVLRVCVSPAPSGSLPFASQPPSQFLDVSLGRSWQQHQRSPFLTLIKLSFRPETCPDPSPPQVLSGLWTTPPAPLILAKETTEKCVNPSKAPAHFTGISPGVALLLPKAQGPTVHSK